MNEFSKYVLLVFLFSINSNAIESPVGYESTTMVINIEDKSDNIEVVTGWHVTCEKAKANFYSAEYYKTLGIPQGKTVTKVTIKKECSEYRGPNREMTGMEKARAVISVGSPLELTL
ncbi:MAG: hypothetical protein KDD58_15365 [Bdellovibrionales bacterium]|nr:hypothetical protein [Bdellovibrionales bacterium]